MNRKYLSNRFSPHSLLLIAVLITVLILITAFTESVRAAPVEPLDFCIGVDHPPFDEQYVGDGYSYFRLGLTMSLEYYDEGSEFTGELNGSEDMVTSDDVLDANGQLFFIFPLYSYGSYVVYVYDDSGEMVFQNDVIVDDSEPICDPESLSTSPPREEPTETIATEVTETLETEVTETPETEVTETPETEVTETIATEVTETLETEVIETPETTVETSQTVTEEPDEMVWWPLLIIAGGVLFVLIGIIILLKRKCDKERKAWLAATEHAAAASDAARRAEEAAEKLSEEREQLEEELVDIRRTYPSAGRPGGDEAWIEMDDRRITSRDVAMRREEERAAWDEYRSDPNPESATELEEDWKESAAPQSEEERRELDEKAKELEEAIEAAKEAENEAVEQAESTKAAEEQAIQEADEARRAYEECMKAALAPPKPAPDTTPGTTDGPPLGGPSVTTGGDEKHYCNDNDPPQKRNRRNLGRVSIPVKLEVIIDGGGAHEGAVAANDISGQLADASETLGWISKLMDIKGIGGSLVRDGVGWSLLGAATPPAAGQAFDIPVPTSPGQLAVDTLSILGRISSIIIGKVPELQERRLPDCDVSATISNNVFSAECVEIWVCRNEQWVKDRLRFTITLISKSSGRMTKRRALTWAQAQQLIRQYEQLYRGRLARALDDLAELEAGCR